LRNEGQQGKVWETIVDEIEGEKDASKKLKCKKESG